MSQIKPALLIVIYLSYLFSLTVFAHDERKLNTDASATYLGNEGVLISTDAGKVLFDPFFHNDYGSYQLVPDDIRQAIFAGDAPYDNINIVIISHAHGDHFSAEDTLAYLKNNEAIKLVAPKQAIRLIEALGESELVASQLFSVELVLGDAPKIQTLGAIEIESVRIPHAGWPNRKDVSNLVHRVSFPDGVSVIHMGDADPNDIHFKPYKEHWEKSRSSLAFPPYWFFISEQGPMILSERINAEKSIGVHVPIDVPIKLKNSGSDYFSKPGERRDIER